MGEELEEMDMLDRLLQDLEKQEAKPKLALTKIAKKEDVPHSSVQDFHDRTEPDNVLHIHENEDKLQESDVNISWDQDRQGYVEEPELSTPKKGQPLHIRGVDWNRGWRCAAKQPSPREINREWRCAAKQPSTKGITEKSK